MSLDNTDDKRLLAIVNWKLSEGKATSLSGELRLAAQAWIDQQETLMKMALGGEI